jgi:hypothetical protein
MTDFSQRKGRGSLLPGAENLLAKVGLAWDATKKGWLGRQDYSQPYYAVPNPPATPRENAVVAQQRAAVRAATGAPARAQSRPTAPAGAQPIRADDINRAAQWHMAGLEKTPEQRKVFTDRWMAGEFDGPQYRVPIVQTPRPTTSYDPKKWEEERLGLYAGKTPGALLALLADESGKTPDQVRAAAGFGNALADLGGGAKDMASDRSRIRSLKPSD